MITEKEITSLIQRIEKSDSFGSGATYSRLLRFLVAGTQAGNVPKEHAVSEYLFGSNMEGGDTSKVRVYVYNLRKKLRAFFEEEGKEEPYELLIPKGGYQVAFKKRKTGFSLPIVGGRLRWILIGLLGLLAASLFLNIYLTKERSDAEQNTLVASPFWKDLVHDDKPLLVVLGDLFIYSEYDSLNKITNVVRNSEVNSEEQFKIFRDSSNRLHRSYEEVPYPFLIRGSTEWVMSLTKLLHPHKDFSIRVRTSIEAKDLHDHNIVFVGMQKTAGLLNSYFDTSNFEYDVSRSSEFVANKNGEKVLYKPNGSPTGKHRDYGMIAKYKGPNNNTIFMFSGLWDTAASESLRNFTVDSKLKTMEKYMQNQLGHIPEYFELFIEVNGMNRIGFDTKVLQLREIEYED